MKRTVNAVEELRNRRAALPWITLGTALSIGLGASFPRLTPWFGGERPVHGVLAIALAVLSSVPRYLARRGERWGAREQGVWTATLLLLSLLGGTIREPVNVILALEAATLWDFVMRDPEDRWVMVAIASVALHPSVSLLLFPTGAHGGLAHSVAALAAVQCAAALLAVQTRRYREALLQHEALQALPAPAPRPRRPAVESEPAPRAAERPRSNTARKLAAVEQDEGWEVLVERVRLTLAQLAESTGAASRVEAELKGLAPPSSRLRTHLPRIAQEVTMHAVRTAQARNVVLTLRRADGGVVLEVHDDGEGTEAQRQKRTVVPLRGRVAALGGRAELRKNDTGWITKVRLPAEWLN